MGSVNRLHQKSLLWLLFHTTYNHDRLSKWSNFSIYDHLFASVNHFSRIINNIYKIRIPYKRDENLLRI